MARRHHLELVGSATHPATDPRAQLAWQAWLRALATDAEAALAAAITYDSLEPSARESWLDALDQDAPVVPVPRIALYAPLLSVEQDPERLERIRQALLGDEEDIPPLPEPRALRGVDEDRDRVIVLVLPLYLSFVQVFSCRYRVGDGFRWAKHEPFLHSVDAPLAPQIVDGILLERTPMKPVVEELAHAVVAHGRSGKLQPGALHALLDLFTPELDLLE
jgi:hypothetical protein